MDAQTRWCVLQLAAQCVDERATVDEIIDVARKFLSFVVDSDDFAKSHTRH